MSKPNELMADVERDVGAYIKTLRAIDPGASDESYRRLHKKLCPMIHEMRQSALGVGRTKEGDHDR